MFVTKKLLERVEELLGGLEIRVKWMEQNALNPAWAGEDTSIRWAAERVLHISVELAVDIANEVIDALVMREPGGYLDIFSVLLDEAVVDRLWFDEFAKVVELRGRLVRHYGQNAEDGLQQYVQMSVPLFHQYCGFIAEYLHLER